MLIALCARWVDLPLALWIDRNLSRHLAHLRHANIPDLLLLVVVVLTGWSWLEYLYFMRRKVHDWRQVFFRMVGTVIPVTFVLKEVLKWIFGRTNPRVWLSHPSQGDFHWFAGGGGFESFPSGHMLVFTPLFMALWQFLPRYRVLSGIAWSCLAAALVFTEYHYLGDVIAGAWLGAVTYAVLGRPFAQPPIMESPQSPA